MRKVPEAQQVSAPTARRRTAKDLCRLLVMECDHKRLDCEDIGCCGALSARVESALAILARFRAPETAGCYDAALLAEEIQAALDWRQE